MNIQLIIVISLVVLAIIYVAKNIYKSVKGHACETSSCGCEKKPIKPVSPPLNN